MDDVAAWEALDARGLTDGLPVVPPRKALVERAVAASGRSADELIAAVPPAHGRATVERIAINAVMAGCRPEYLAVVIAGVEAMCDEAFALLGISGTTDAVAPLFIVNGPARTRLGINCGAGLLGPGFRPNATIGRALRLVWVNVGGARPGAISMSTFGNPARYAACFGEHEEASPWPPLHVEHGFASEDSTVTAMAGEPLQICTDAQARTAREVLTTVARSLAVVASYKLRSLGDTLLIVSPEHARTIAGDGWSKAEARAFLYDECEKAAGPGPAPKFRGPQHLHLIVAGGTAGRFTAIVPGWPFPDSPAGLVIKRIH